MNEQRKPSEEKVYLKNYPKGAAETSLPKTKLDEYFLNINGKEQERTGMIYAPTGEEILIGQMIEKYEDTVKALIGMGLEPKDNVAVCLLNVPEMIYTILACSKLGVTINMVNPMAEPADIIARINSLNPKALIAQDKTAPLFTGIKDYINVPNIITAPIVEGYTNADMEPLDKNVGFWSDFINNGKYVTKTFEVPYDETTPFIYAHSSGSTGPTKTIELGHNTFTHTAHMHAVAGLDIEPGDKWLATIPAIFSTGVNSSVVLPLLIKMALILEPNYDPDAYLQNILRFAPRAEIATKYFHKCMLYDPRFNGVDLSFLRYPVIGGEKVRRHESRKFDSFLEEHNNFYGVGNGSGQCELGGGVANSCLNEKSKGNNTIGFPYTHNTITIRDLETAEEVDYNQRGEITVQTTTGMLGYAGMPEKTQEYYKNGEANTGDLGYVNENGEYYIDGRISDFIKISDDVKLYPYEIEDIVEDFLESDPIFDEIVKDYAVHGVMNGEFEIPMLQLHIADEYMDRAEAIINYLYKEINNKISSDKQIAAYKIRTEAFPSTSAGKTDLGSFKIETEGFVTVDENQKLKPYVLKLGTRK